MENIAQSIKMLSDLIEKKANSELSYCNITIAQARILIYLLSQPCHISMKELERIFNVSQATMQGTISRMEKKGYLCTVYLPDNRRQKLVVLTDYGKTVAHTLLKRMNGINSQIAQPLTADEMETFCRIITKLNSSLQ